MPSTLPIPDLSPTEFRTILLSHGWFDLPPFIADIKGLTLDFPYELPQGYGRIKITSTAKGCQMEVHSGDIHQAQTVMRNCLSLDLDNAPLHALIKNTDFNWIAESLFGRYLRGCSLFEDCFKIMLTTNCNWKRTKTMAQRTVDAFGHDIAGLKAFPLPAYFANVTEAQLQQTIGCGYRARGLMNLCRQAIQYPNLFTGHDWQGLSGEDFNARFKGITGMGPMCVSYLCRFYGKPGDFTIDAWAIKRCLELWNIESDRATIQKYLSKRYRLFGDYAASVCWFELTRYWHERELVPDWWK